MRVPLADWARPTDADFAFHLRPGLIPARPARRTAVDIRDVGRQALIEGHGDRFEARVARWGGPEDEDGDGLRPYAAPQLRFEERGWRPLGAVDVDEILAGTVRVMRRDAADGGEQVDYVLRDHHMLDVVLYHYRTTGDLPTALFHADRHSDWCRDGYLTGARPAQAATWWALIEGLKRPDGGAVLGERTVTFTTAQPGPEVVLAGRDVGAGLRVPWWVDKDSLAWPAALALASDRDPDWVSLDLDYFQPLEQLALTAGLLRDERFHGLMRRAKVRVFVLSPQFTAGGDVLRDWTVGARRHASVRMVNLVRAMRMRVAA